MFLLITLSALPACHSGLKVGVVTTPLEINGSDIEQDDDGHLLSSLSTELIRYGYSISSREADLRLHVQLHSGDTTQIGFRYDVNASNQSTTTRLVANEEEKTVKAQVWLTSNGKTILGPERLKGVARYDFIDSNALTDVQTSSENTLGFSFGQLDAVQGARGVASETAYDDLSKEIACWLSQNHVQLSSAVNAVTDKKD